MLATKPQWQLCLNLAVSVCSHIYWSILNGGIPIPTSIVWSEHTNYWLNLPADEQRGFSLWGPLDIAITGLISLLAVLLIRVSRPAQ